MDSRVPLAQFPARNFRPRRREKARNANWPEEQRRRFTILRREEERERERETEAAWWFPLVRGKGDEPAGFDRSRDFF